MMVSRILLGVCLSSCSLVAAASSGCPDFYRLRLSTHELAIPLGLTTVLFDPPVPNVLAIFHPHMPGHAPAVIGARLVSGAQAKRGRESEEDPELLLDESGAGWRLKVIDMSRGGSAQRQLSRFNFGEYQLIMSGVDLVDTARCIKDRTISDRSESETEVTGSEVTGSGQSS